ncbi:putative ATP-dependent dna helicase q1 [Fusarium flagelliforme]|uniref:DNA 3'-5' helicase n=2 Tax=Fusarium flagelliforme TaxID=2675880 RepID=A0A395N4P0_9HYPO|nr:putative ATP-dependent dna helicase q1 [Fusarium flagelliforme]
MEPFIHVLELPFVICKVSDQIDEIIKAVDAIPGLVRRQDELHDFQFPDASNEAIPYLEPPRGGMRGCPTCGYFVSDQRGIQAHYRKEHGWENDWKKGGNIKKKLEQPRETPWIEGAYCQRFFRRRRASRWFQVRKDDESEVQTAINHEPREDAVKRLIRIHQEQVDKFNAAEEDEIKVADEKKEPSAWLERTGWADHLQKFKAKKDLLPLATPLQEDEPVLQVMCDTFDRLADHAKAAAVPSIVGLAALYQIERKEIHIKPSKPFDNRLEDESWAQYKGYWMTMLRIWHRMDGRQDEDRPPYKLTIRQGDLWDEFGEAAEAVVAGQAREKGLTDEKMERLCLDMLIGMLDHQFKQSHYDSIVLSALAIMGINEDGGWIEPTDYTPKYSGVIKVARMLVLYQSWHEREEDVAEKMRTMDKDEAREEAKGMYRIVREKSQRFMTRVSEKNDSEPTPMDWIFDARTYGMKIRYATAAGGTIDWRGEEITYRQVRFTMGSLSEMFHSLVQEARSMLCELTMVGDNNLEALPKIEWTKMEDDHSEARVGYSFLTDSRNEWVVKGKNWVLNQILESKRRQKEWLSEGPDGSCPYKMKAVKSYGRLVEQFREVLNLLWITLCGMPMRTTEATGVRMCNTVNGGIRNIFAHGMMLFFVVLYHKGFRRTGSAKIIHRYLPREVSELVIWYMWIVLEFWQQVQGMVKGGDRCSAFLWADEIVSRIDTEDEREQRELREQEEDDGRVSVISQSQQVRLGDNVAVDEIDHEDRKDMRDRIKERKWNSDRLRRIMQKHSERLLGCRMNIIAWRNIAIAIANRYLNASFGQGEEGGDGEDGDEDEIDDNAWDLQAGHGTHVAGMIYARELQQGLFETAALREKYRIISRRWHRFFGFGVEDRQGTESGMAKKRKRELYEDVQEETRFRRFKRLRQVDIVGQLKRMMGPEAEFRGNQEKAIRAIIRGESRIVQVMGTGGGKSLSFMLPAFCASDSTTVVVTPLVALRNNMHDRCAKHKITSYIWQSRGSNQSGASIIFVTPESAVTKGFQDFVNRMLSRQALDRVVIDECHSVLDSTRQFRPQLLQLGEVVNNWGVQVVCLTATLALDDEPEFFRRMKLSKDHLLLFRERTTRKNIRYRVEIVDSGTGNGNSRKGRGGQSRSKRRQTGSDDEEDEQEAEENKMVYGIVRDWMNRGVNGKVIVYAGSINRVERLGQGFGCPTYWNKVDTEEGKAKRMDEWMAGNRYEGGLIVATNALGMGMDVPDVRLVVHAGMPRQLRNFVQESGRAGRDGQESEAVVVCGKWMVEDASGGRQDMAKAHIPSTGTGWEGSTKEYVKGDGCRRVVLDRVMDGRMDRWECEEGEQPCDVCERRGLEQVMGEEDYEDSVFGATGSQQEATTGAMENEFKHTNQIGKYRRWQTGRHIMGEAREAQEFEMQLERWSGSCVVCRMGLGLKDGEETQHEMAQCPNRDSERWYWISDAIMMVEKELFERRRMELFSGCFDCGMPQEICDRWAANDEDGGRFSRVSESRCQHAGLTTSQQRPGLTTSQQRPGLAGS